jgi:hypothetical protein
MAAGCGGDGDGSSESQRLDPAVAEQLAEQSDAVADAIAANDGCLAAERRDELRATLDAEVVPEAIRREVERIAAREFTCAPPAPPPPPPTVPTDDEGDDDEEGKGKKDKKDKKNRGDGDDD